MSTFDLVPVYNCIWKKLCFFITFFFFGKVLHFGGLKVEKLWPLCPLTLTWKCLPLKQEIDPTHWSDFRTPSRKMKEETPGKKSRNWRVWTWPATLYHLLRYRMHTGNLTLHLHSGTTVKMWNRGKEASCEHAIPEATIHVGGHSLSLRCPHAHKKPLRRTCTSVL